MPSTRSYDATMQFEARRRNELMEGAEPLECERLSVAPRDVQPDDLYKYASGQQMIVTEVVKGKKIKGRQTYSLKGFHYIYMTEVIATVFANQELSVVRAIEPTDADSPDSEDEND